MDVPPAEELLLKKHQMLGTGHADLEEELFQFKDYSKHQGALSVLPQSSRFFSSHEPERRQGGDAGATQLSTLNFSDWRYLNILQSLGQSVHIFDRNGLITYWNRTAGNLYGYSVAEALGQNPVDLIADPQAFMLADDLVKYSITKGATWSGPFPVKNKMGERFLAAVTLTPFYDDIGTFIGVICVSTDMRLFEGTSVQLLGVELPEPDSSFQIQASTLIPYLAHQLDHLLTTSVAPELDHQQPMQNAIASKITNFASKVGNKVTWRFKARENSRNCKPGNEENSYLHEHDSVYVAFDHREDTNSNGAGTPKGDRSMSPFAVFSKINDIFPGKTTPDSGDGSKGKHSVHKVITSKAEAWIGKKGKAWPWKENGREGSEARTTFAWPWSHNGVAKDIHQISYCSSKPGIQVKESNLENDEASECYASSMNVNRPSNNSRCGSINSSAAYVDLDIDCLDYEILWEDVVIGQLIGQGSCGTVYRGLCYGSDVAVKEFFKKEYSDDVLLSFRQEVSLMKRLRHPNVVHFMGAVTSPQRLCIVTEFLPCGSLFQLLQKSKLKPGWRRRVQMGLDIARGMKYLHHFNPPIVHRDLKSSNVLVDKNWNVKVGDFGLSRLKHETFVGTKTAETAQWMAPEVLCNGSSDEKSDVYSFGVILWELTTEKIPWDNLNAMQVAGAVGFRSQRLEIPDDVDPHWASMIESCWHSDPSFRPTFKELLKKLKELQRQQALQLKARVLSPSSVINSAQNEL